MSLNYILIAVILSCTVGFYISLLTIELLFENTHKGIRIVIEIIVAILIGCLLAYGALYQWGGFMQR